MTCMKITESQNGQIYPEDTFSHGAAHFYCCFLVSVDFLRQSFKHTDKLKMSFFR